jgi:hypothetical protein
MINKTYNKMLRKFLSSLFVLALLVVGGSFLLAKDASAQNISVSPTTISCGNNEVTFTVSGMEDGTRYRVRFWENEGNRPVVSTFTYSGTSGQYVFRRTINIDNECDGETDLNLSAGIYEVRLHEEPENEGDAWIRHDEVRGVQVSSDGSTPPGDGGGDGGDGGGSTGGGNPSTVPAAPAPLWYDQSFSEWQAKVYARGNEQEIFGERYTAAQVQWVIYALAHNIMNMTGHGDIFACVNDPANSNGDALDANCGEAVRDAASRFSTQSVSNRSGDSGDTSDTGEKNALATLFEPRPISFVGYVGGIAQRMADLNIIPEAKAQTGFGFTAFDPVRYLWLNVRNATYLLLVIVIIVMAFMIMFRTKINPQTVITVQSALPKIIIALILITFSYAIAGLMVDLMYLVMGIVAAIFTWGDSISDLPWSEFFGGMTSENGVLMLYVSYWFFAILALILTIPGLFVTAGLVGASFASGGVIAGIALIILVVFMIFLVIIGLRVLWLLVRTYVTILLLVILGPIQILAGTVAPRAGFGSWLRNLLANLAVYPVVAGMFIIAFVFLSGGMSPIADAFGLTDALPFGVGGAIEADTTWRPPLTGAFADVDILLWVAASFGVVMMIPSAGNMIRSAIQGREFNFGTAFGQSLRTAGIVGGAYGIAKTSTLSGAYQSDVGRGVLRRLTKYDRGRGSGLVKAIGRGIESYGLRNKYTK